jgi:hypothetical protein
VIRVCLVFGDRLAPTADTPIALDRSILLLPDVPQGGKAGLTVNESVMPRTDPIRPPTGAPNIVILLPGMKPLPHLMKEDKAGVEGGSAV